MIAWHKMWWYENSCIQDVGNAKKDLTSDIGCDIIKLSRSGGHKMRNLREERRELAGRIKSLLDSAQDAKMRGWESGDGSGSYQIAGKADEMKAKGLMEELKKFDLEHPEIIAEIKREKAEKAARHIWD